MQKEDKKTLISQSEDGVIGPMDEGLDHNDDSKGLLESGRQTKTSRDLYFHYLKRTIYSLLIIFSFATILSHYFFPVIYTYGDDMAPKVKANSLLIGNKLAKINQGDIIAYYYGNETIVSRVLALPGQLVERDEKGNEVVSLYYKMPKGLVLETQKGIIYRRGTTEEIGTFNIDKDGTVHFKYNDVKDNDNIFYGDFTFQATIDANRTENDKLVFNKANGEVEYDVNTPKSDIKVEKTGKSISDTLPEGLEFISDIDVYRDSDVKSSKNGEVT